MWMQPIAGYNFGAKLYPRCDGSTESNHLLCNCSDNSGFLWIGMFIPEIVSSIFTSDEELISIV